MAQLYLSQDEQAEVARLQSEIQQKQAQVSDSLSEGDSAKVKAYVADLESLKKSLEEVAKTAAKAAQSLSMGPSAAAQKLFTGTIDAYEKYAKQRAEIIREFSEKIEEDPENKKKYERQEDRQLKKNDSTLAEELGALVLPAADEALTQLQTLMSERSAELQSQIAATDSESPELPKMEEDLKTVQKTDVAVSSVKNNMAQVKENAKESAKAVKDFSEMATGFGNLSKSLTGLGAVLDDDGKAAADAAANVFSMFQGICSGISNIVKVSSSGAQAAAATGVTALSTMEKASLILTIISAAVQVATAIISLFNNDKMYEKIQKNSKLIEDQLKFVMDNGDAVAINEKVNAVELLTDAYATYLSAMLKTGDILGFLTTPLHVFLKDNQAVTDQLVKAYGNLGYTIGKSLGDDKFDSAHSQLENLARQQQELMIQKNAEENKKKSDDSAIQEYEQNIQKLGAEMVKVLSDMTETIMGGSAEKITKELGDAFMEAFVKGEDAAQAWKDKVDDLVADIIKRMLIQSILEKQIGDVFDRYQKQWFKDGEYAGTDAVIDSMGNLKKELNDIGDSFSALMDGLDSSILGNMDIENTSNGVSGSPFQTMSQDTGDELSARFADLQQKGSGILDLMGSFTAVSEQLRNTHIEARDIAAETRDYTVMGYQQLQLIADNTHRVVLPIQEIADKITTISSHLRDL